jgi:beta-fructofuranosidase
MQYFRPADPSLNVGDCLPFFHGDVYHFVYLLDENHHRAKGGLGAHQWAQATSTDLRHWEHHPLMIPITREEECSICTGSVFVYEGIYYAFYATRMPDWSEHLSLATSRDGITYTKQEPNPFASPPSGFTKAYRDPHVFRDPDTGRFHLLVTSAREAPAVHNRGGCLARLVSEDLHHWEPVEPFIEPGYPGDPECCEHFHWGDWYYLVFSNHGIARYKMSRHAQGPWETPPVDTFDGAMARVAKSAPFTGGRRISVAFVPDLADGKDDGGWLYAGCAVFRELVQRSDGTLGTRFPEEMMPPAGEPVALAWEARAGDLRQSGGLTLTAGAGLAAARASGVPADARITVQVVPGAGATWSGLCLRSSADYAAGYELRCWHHEGKVEVRKTGLGMEADNGSHSITGVTGLDRPFGLDVVLKGSIIDVCVDGRRCMVNRFPEATGPALFAVVQNGSTEFRGLKLRELR